MIIWEILTKEVNEKVKKCEGKMGKNRPMETNRNKELFSIYKEHSTDTTHTRTYLE